MNDPRMTDLELLAQVWVGDGLERAVIEVERTDRDELRVGVVCGLEGREDVTHVYIERDRALKLGHALIEQALAGWQT